MSVNHRLLLRQLRRHGATETSPPADWPAFLSAIDAAYIQSDSDRHLLDRAMKISSQELGAAIDRLKQQNIRNETVLGRLSFISAAESITPSPTMPSISVWPGPTSSGVRIRRESSVKFASSFSSGKSIR